MTRVTIELRTVGQRSATYAALRDTKTRRVLAETDLVPRVLVGNVVQHARDIADDRGWTVVGAFA